MKFSCYLPRVTSSVGGVKSGGLNNDSNSQSYNLNVTQLVYDFGVTGKEVDAVEKESLASQSKVESQRTDLLLEIIKPFMRSTERRNNYYCRKVLLIHGEGFWSPLGVEN